MAVWPVSRERGMFTPLYVTESSSLGWALFWGLWNILETGCQQSYVTLKCMCNPLKVWQYILIWPISHLGKIKLNPLPHSLNSKNSFLGNLPEFGTICSALCLSAPGVTVVHMATLQLVVRTCSFTHLVLSQKNHSFSSREADANSGPGVRQRAWLCIARTGNGPSKTTGCQAQVCFLLWANGRLLSSRPWNGEAKSLGSRSPRSLDGIHREWRGASQNAKAKSKGELTANFNLLPNPSTDQTLGVRSGRRVNAAATSTTGDYSQSKREMG